MFFQPVLHEFIFKILSPLIQVAIISSLLHITEVNFFLKITLHLRLALMIVCGIAAMWHRGI